MLTPSTAPTTAHLQTTIQGIVSGLHWGLGFGLGAIFGGMLYAGLGARLCFRVSAVLPALSLLLLALSKARHCYGNRGKPRARWMTPSGQRGQSDGGKYELVAMVSTGGNVVNTIFE